VGSSLEDVIVLNAPNWRKDNFLSLIKSLCHENFT
jgi:hypothetical protein